VPKELTAWPPPFGNNLKTLIKFQRSKHFSHSPRSPNRGMIDSDNSIIPSSYISDLGNCYQGCNDWWKLAFRATIPSCVFRKRSILPFPNIVGCGVRASEIAEPLKPHLAENLAILDEKRPIFTNKYIRYASAPDSLVNWNSSRWAQSEASALSYDEKLQARIVKFLRERVFSLHDHLATPSQ
jgi:hypothetical protein